MRKLILSIIFVALFIIYSVVFGAMSVNDPLYTEGSLTLLQSTGTEPTIYFAEGSLYFVHEYVVAGGTAAQVIMMSW